MRRPTLLEVCLLSLIAAIVVGALAREAKGEVAREQRLAAQLTKERDAHHRQIARLARAKAPTVRTALALAQAVYGTPPRGMQALAWCESRHTASARNPVALSGSHASGYTQILFDRSGRRSSTWHTTPFRHLDPFDLTTNVLAAGYIWRRNDGKPRPGFGEWRDRCTLAGDRAS